MQGRNPAVIEDLFVDAADEAVLPGVVVVPEQHEVHFHRRHLVALQIRRQITVDFALRQNEKRVWVAVRGLGHKREVRGAVGVVRRVVLRFLGAGGLVCRVDDQRTGEEILEREIIVALDADFTLNLSVCLVAVELMAGFAAGLARKLDGLGEVQALDAPQNACISLRERVGRRAVYARGVMTAPEQPTRAWFVVGFGMIGIPCETSW